MKSLYYLLTFSHGERGAKIILALKSFLPLGIKNSGMSYLGIWVDWKYHCSYRVTEQKKKPPFVVDGFYEIQYYYSVTANTSETIDISLIRMFSEGPEVSLKGSPTVSPVTAAL